MSDDTPTQRFDAPLTPTGGPVATPEEPEKKNRGLLIALISVGALLLIAVIVLLIVLLGGRSTPTAATTSTPSVTPSETPSASPSPTSSSSPSNAASSSPAPAPAPAPPAASGPTLTNFSGTNTVSCDAANNPIPLDFSWKGSGAAAYIAAGATADPKANGQGWTLPPTGTQDNFPDGQGFTFPCYQASATYTLGVYDNDGHKVVKQFTFKNTGTVK